MCHAGLFTQCAFPHPEEATLILIAKCAVQVHEKIFVSDAMKAQAAILEYVQVTTPKGAVILFMLCVLATGTIDLPVVYVDIHYEAKYITGQKT